MVKKRLFNLDVCRTIAIILIITNHILIAVYSQPIDYMTWLGLNGFEKVFDVLCYILSRIGVPLFLFLTGVLILQKKFETGKDIRKFYKHNLLPLVIATVVWDVIYFVFLAIFKPEYGLTFQDLLYDVLFLRESFPEMGHMWYMPMIIGIYLFLPLVSVVVKKFSLKDLAIPMVITIIAGFVLPNFQMLLEYFRSTWPPVVTVLDLMIGGAPYLVYIVLGYYVYHDKLLARLKMPYLWVGFILMILVGVLYQMVGYVQLNTGAVDYDFIGVLGGGIFLFEILRRIDKPRNTKLVKVVTGMSEMAFALFFVHRPVLMLLDDWLPQMDALAVRYVILLVLTVVASVVIVWWLKKIPVIKKYVLVIKD